MKYPRLYKYLHTDRIDILKTGCFRYTQPAAMNDPFDVSPFISAGSDEYIREKFTQRALKDMESARATRELFKGMSAYEVVKKRAEEDMRDEIEFNIKVWKQHEKKMGERIKKSINEQVGLFCMTANPSSILMWSHYASSHQGLSWNLMLHTNSSPKRKGRAISDRSSTQRFALAFRHTLTLKRTRCLQKAWIGNTKKNGAWSSR